jgi:LacI family transcriptional regulator
LAPSCPPSRAPGGGDVSGNLASYSVGMHKQVTIKDVALRAGVHPATVSRALNQATRHVVHAATAERVMKAARELAYEPDLTARTLRTGRTASVGILIPDLTNPLFPPIVRGIEDCLAEQGYTALMANTDNDETRESQVFRALRTRQVDGFILLTTHRNDTTLKSLIADGIPVVTVNRVARGPMVSSVSCDDKSGISQLVDHLVKLGHRRIAAVSGPQSLSIARVRHRALKLALGRHGLSLAEGSTVFARGFIEAEGNRCMTELLARTDASAVVAASDSLAVGCLDAMAREGVRCPEDMSLTGYNDMLFMDKLSPPLTTVRIPHRLVGVTAGRIMLDQLSGARDMPEHVVLPVEIVIRRSTAAVNG